MGSTPITLTDAERSQVTDILRRRANDIATFQVDLEKATERKLNGFPGSVEMALSREIRRLRALADKIAPPRPEDDDESSEE